MHLKDYYAILEIEPSASIPEIKKSFRKLAQKFHPDKNKDDPYSTAQFNEIKEAYEVLTNPAKKNFYLQQRWYEQSIGKRKNQVAITPVNILKQILELEKHVSKLDIYRMDKQGLEQYILELLSNDTIDKVNKFNELEANSQIIQTTLKTINALPTKYTAKIIDQLYKMAVNSDPDTKQIEVFMDKAKRKYLREKYSLLFIITITIILCLLIFLAGG